MENLEKKTIAILATNGFEESELFEPKNALEQAGADVHIVSLQKGNITAWKDGNWGKTIKVNKVVTEVNQNNYHALVLPGGVMNPDVLRTNEDAVKFTKSFFIAKKPVAAICHAPWVLAEADVLQGRKVTSYKSIKRDLVNAGAKWQDSAVVVDEGLVTSRTPKDLPAFCKKIVEEVYEGKHDMQTA